MAYTGKKPIDHTDVTQSQSMTVTDDLTINGDTSLVDLAMTGGITFDSRANALDDYEEGTWTPTFSSGSFGSVLNFTYTKIGRTVHITGYLATPSGLPSSTLSIGGLPFSGNASFQMSLLWYNGVSSTIAAAYLSGGSTTLQVRPIGGQPNTFTELSVQMTYITS